VILAKTRKAASSAKKKKTATAKKKSVAKKATAGRKKTAGGRKKSAGATRRATSAKNLDLRPLKRQIRAHVEMLSRASGGDQRVTNAIASLRRVQQELDEHCDPTMTIPLA
jgi:hypothetical protein